MQTTRRHVQVDNFRACVWFVLKVWEASWGVLKASWEAWARRGETERKRGEGNAPMFEDVPSETLIFERWNGYKDFGPVAGRG